MHKGGFLHWNARMRVLVIHSANMSIQVCCWRWIPSRDTFTSGGLETSSRCGCTCINASGKAYHTILWFLLRRPSSVSAFHNIKYSSSSQYYVSALVGPWIRQRTSICQDPWQRYQLALTGFHVEILNVPFESSSWLPFITLAWSILILFARNIYIGDKGQPLITGYRFTKARYVIVCC